MTSQEKIRLQEMKSKIEQIEKLASYLNNLGRGVSVFEKNVQNLLDTVFVLKSAYRISPRLMPLKEVNHG